MQQPLVVNLRLPLSDNCQPDLTALLRDVLFAGESQLNIQLLKKMSLQVLNKTSSRPTTEKKKTR